MGIGVRVGSITDEIGSPDFLHAFFSTISVLTEPDRWGSRFPTLMGPLYAGHLPAREAAKALRELKEARAALAKHPARAVVWDIGDRSLAPPWGDKISPTITNLGNYFVTSTGRDLCELLKEALSTEAQSEIDAFIE